MIGRTAPPESGAQAGSADRPWYWVWPTIMVLSGALVGFGYAFEVQGPIQLLLALWFMLVCPGLPLVKLLHLKSRPIEWIVIVALSLALDTIVATTYSYLGIWSTENCLLTLIGISYVGAVLLLNQRQRAD